MLTELELNTSWMDFETIQALKLAASAPTELLIHLTDGKGKYSRNITDGNYFNNIAVMNTFSITGTKQQKS